MALVLLILAGAAALPRLQDEGVDLKVAQHSGFMGLGGPRYLHIYLTTQNRDSILTCENVNASDSYYFVAEPKENWKIDEDYIGDLRPALRIQQGAGPSEIAIQDTLAAGRKGKAVLLVVSKPQLALHEPVIFRFPDGDTLTNAVLKVPDSLWPGHTKLRKYLAEGDRAMEGSDYRSAIGSYNGILRDQGLAIFSSYGETRSKRLRAFRKYFEDSYGGYLDLYVHDTLALQRKIAKSAEYLGQYQYVADSLPDRSVHIPESDSTVASLLSWVRGKLFRASSELDSLHAALERQKIRFIVNGSSRANDDYRYRLMIEALTYAYLTIDFADTMSRDFRLVLPERFATWLRKFDLLDPYETFVKITKDRRKKGQSLFMPEFLANLRTDSAVFNMPFSQVLKAVDDFSQGSYSEVEREVTEVMKHICDDELNTGLDQLRITARNFLLKVSPEVLAKIKQGRTAEDMGDSALALEYYRDATLMAPDYAPGLYALGKYYERRHDNTRAFPYFAKAINRDPIYFSAYQSMFQIQMSGSDLRRFIESLLESQKKGNDGFASHYYLSEAYNASGFYKEALASSERALQMNEKSVKACLQASVALQGLQSFSKAHAYLEKGLLLDPENEQLLEQKRRLEESSR